MSKSRGQQPKLTNWKTDSHVLTFLSFSMFFATVLAMEVFPAPDLPVIRSAETPVQYQEFGERDRFRISDSLP